MKRTIVLALFIAVFASLSAFAQATASGTLAVTATVTGSINLLIASDASGLALASGSGTNAATLALGSIAAYGTATTGVTRTVNGTTSFTVSTPVDVNVTKVNSASANYKLTAQLSSADAVNTWTVAGTTINNTTATQITAAGTYAATGSAQAIALTVPQTTASGTVISNTINFVATAN